MSDANVQPAGFDACFRVVRTGHAEFFAASLFDEGFHAAFPRAPEGGDWHQFVAFYRWPDDRFEAVGFLNYVRHGEAYLGGGMVVRRNFYRRLSREHFAACAARGGVAQRLLESSMGELTDCDAWFGYCGDKQAYAVDVRAGLRPTRHPHLLVRWCREIPPDRQEALVDEIARLGPF